MQLGQFVPTSPTQAEAEEAAALSVPTRSLSEALGDTTLRSYMDPTERQIGGYSFFVPSGLNEVVEEANWGRYFQRLTASDLVRVTFTVHPKPDLPTLKGRRTPILTEDGTGTVRGYFGAEDKVRVLTDRGAEVMTLAPVNGIQFARVVLRPKRGMQTIYYLALHEGNLLTFRNDFSANAENVLSQISVMQGAPASIAPIK